MASPAAPSETDPRRWWLLLSLCVVAAIAYLQRQVPGTLATSIQADVGLDKNEMGTVLGAFFFSYAALQIPAGWMCQAWGVRRSLITMVGLWSLASALAAAAAGPHMLQTSRLLLGAAQAGLFTGTTLAIRDWFPRSEYGFANGLLATGMQVGGVLGTTLAGELAVAWGWRGVLAACALPGIPWIVCHLLLDRPRDSRLAGNPEPAPTQPAPTAEAASPADGLLQVAWVLLGSWSLWCLCTQQFFRAAAQAFYATWFSTYLQEARHLDISKAGWYTAGPIAAAAIGPFLGGWLSDWLTRTTGRSWGARHGVACLSMLGCAGLMAVGHLIPQTSIAVTVIAVANLLSAAAGPAAYSASMHMGGRWLAPVFAVMNMLGNLGAALFPKAVTWLLPPAASGATSSLADWNRVFLVIAGTYVISATSWLLFDSNRCIADK